MKLPDAIKSAIETPDVKLMGRIVDYFRFQCFLGYEDAYERINSIHPISKENYNLFIDEIDHTRKILA